MLPTPDSDLAIPDSDLATPDSGLVSIPALGGSSQKLKRPELVSRIIDNKIELQWSKAVPHSY